MHTTQQVAKIFTQVIPQISHRGDYLLIAVRGKKSKLPIAKAATGRNNVRIINMGY